MRSKVVFFPPTDMLVSLRKTLTRIPAMLNSLSSSVGVLQKTRPAPNGDAAMGSSEDSELISVFVLHRHSIRAPTYFPPSSAEINEEFYPRGAGYLTKFGIEKCLEVGEIWKSWYPDHINGSDHRDVFVRSSESPRCSETISAILHGLFSTKHLSPIPIYSPPPGCDKYVSMAGCVRDVNQEFRQHHSLPLNVKNSAGAETVGQLVNFIKRSFNDPEGNEYDAFVYVDGFTSNIYEKLPLPAFYIENEAAIEYLYKFAYDVVIEQFRPFYGYHLIRGMASRMKMVVDEELTGGVKWNDYSFHDFSVTAVLHALDPLYSKYKPNFLGAIFFELRRCKNTDIYFVDLHYTPGISPDGTYAPKKQLPLSWNDDSNRVDFDQLYDRMTNNVYEDIMSNLKSGKYSEDNAMV